MKLPDMIIKEYNDNGIITDVEAHAIMEKCAEMVKEAGFFDFLRRSKKVAKSAAEGSAEILAKNLDDIRKAKGATAKTGLPIKKPTFWESFKESFRKPSVHGPLVATGAASLIGGATGATKLIVEKAKENKSIKNNYTNLVRTNPKFRKYPKDKVEGAIRELIRLSPLAATNDTVLSNYVEKKLSNQLQAQDLSTVSSIGNKSKSPIWEGIVRPPQFAVSAGQIIRGTMAEQPHEKYLRIAPESALRDAIAVKGIIDSDQSLRNLINREFATRAQNSEYLKGVSERTLMPEEDLNDAAKNIREEYGLEKESMVKKAKKDPSATATVGYLDNMIKKLIRGGKLKAGMSKSSTATVGDLNNMIKKLIRGGKLKAGMSKSSLRGMGLLKRYLPVFGGLGALGAGVGLTHAGAELYKSGKERKKMRSTLESIKKIPELEGKTKEVDMAFSTLAKFAPSLATAPQTAIPFVRNAVLEYADPSTGIPMAFPTEVKNLVDLQRGYEGVDAKSPFATAFTKGFGRGFSGATSATKSLTDIARITD